MSKNLLQFGGRPTEPDVATLRETFGVPKEGVPIPYNEIAQAIHEPERSSRWKTVTNAWRKWLLREHNILLRASGGCLSVLEPGARVDHAGRRVHSGMNTIRRAESVVVSTDRARLSEEDKRRADHTQLLASALMHHARAEARKIKAQLPASVKARN